MTSLDVTHIPPAQGETMLSHNIQSYKSSICGKELSLTKEGAEKCLSHTLQDSNAFIHHPLQLTDIQINALTF